MRVLGPVNVELQLKRRSKPFIVHIDKVKPYFGEPPKGWLETVNEVDVSELVEKGAGETSLSFCFRCRGFSE